MAGFQREEEERVRYGNPITVRVKIGEVQHVIFKEERDHWLGYRFEFH